MSDMIEQMKRALSASRRPEPEPLGYFPIYLGPRQYQDFLDVARPSRRWARRFIRLSRREALGLAKEQPYRSPALRIREGRSGPMRRHVRRVSRPLPFLGMRPDDMR